MKYKLILCTPFTHNKTFKKIIFPNFNKSKFSTYIFRLEHKKKIENVTHKYKKREIYLILNVKMKKASSYDLCYAFVWMMLQQKNIKKRTFSNTNIVCCWYLVLPFSTLFLSGGNWLLWSIYRILNSFKIAYIRGFKA